MEKNYKKRFLTKLIVFIYFLLNPIISFAEIGDQKWSKECNVNKQCAVVIVKQKSFSGSDKKQTIASAIIQLAPTTKREMALLDGEEKTYKLKETNKLVPVLFIKLPLNINLKKIPLLVIDKKEILNLPFSHCNSKDGCVVSTSIPNDVLKLLKKGDVLTIQAAIYRSKDILNLEFPLKGFSKSYKSLLK